jgi:uncharacterized protein (TIGR02996 family)
MMRNERLHAAVLAAPDDDAPRLAYADWLAEHGDPRGEMIALAVARARLPAGDPRGTELWEREKTLWERHGEEWRAPYGTLLPEYSRGFLETLIGSPAQLAEFGLAAARDGCVRGLKLQARAPDEIDIQALIEPLLPHIRLRDLSCWRAVLPIDPLRTLLSYPAMHDLESLFLDRVPLGDAGVAMLATARLTRLRSLTLRSAGLTRSALRELAAWPGTLQTLRLSGNEFGAASVASLVAAPALRELSTLDLSGTGIAGPDVDALADASLPLVSLDLSNNPLGTTAVARIAASESFARLTRLGLADTDMGSAGLDALLASTHLPRTLELALDGTVLELEPDIWYEWTGSAIGGSWRGEPPERVTQRFRVVVEGWPSY